MRGITRVVYGSITRVVYSLLWYPGGV